MGSSAAVGTGSVNEETVVRSITSNFGTYVDTWGHITWGVYMSVQATMSVDYVKMDVTKSATNYMMDIEFNTSNVLAGDEFYLQLNYSVDGSETDFGVLVYNGATDIWDDFKTQGDLSSTTFTFQEYTLNSHHLIGTGWTRVRFIGRNESNDNTNSTLQIEYLRIYSKTVKLTLSGTAGTNFGWSVGHCSDINADASFDDVIVGAPNSTNGNAYIYYGGATMDATADLILNGEAAGDKFGYSVHYAGDIDSDGDPDLIVGAPYHTDGTKTRCGAAYVYCGGSALDSTPDYTNYGEFSGDHFGWSVSGAGDIDGDNINETLCGAPYYNTQAYESPASAPDTGKAYVMCIPEFPTYLLPIILIIVIVSINRKRRNYKNSDKKNKGNNNAAINSI